MARWFWYLSPQKVMQLTKPKKGWGFLQDRLGNLTLEVGVPWAKLSLETIPQPSLIKNLEKVEKDIRDNHTVLSADQIRTDQSPLFFEFKGKAGRLVLRESYKEEEGECVFVMVGIQKRTGVILLGAGANVFGADSARPRFTDPSGDPVGALLDLLDRQEEWTAYTRVGVAAKRFLYARNRNHNGEIGITNLRECTLYSFASALRESQKCSFSASIRALAVFAAQVSAPKNAPVWWQHLTLYHHPPIDYLNEACRVTLPKLRQILTTRFNEGELRTLCFDLGIDYDDLPGEGKADKARELVAYLERRDCIIQLVEIGKQLRPDISWDDWNTVWKDAFSSVQKNPPPEWHLKMPDIDRVIVGSPIYVEQLES